MGRVGKRRLRLLPRLLVLKRWSLYQPHRLDLPPPVAFSSVVSVAERTPVKHTLPPTPPAAFRGRENEVAALREYLLADALPTILLYGWPGIGKTALTEAAPGHGLCLSTGQ